LRRRIRVLPLTFRVGAANVAEKQLEKNSTHSDTADIDDIELLGKQWERTR